MANTASDPAFDYHDQVAVVLPARTTSGRSAQAMLDRVLQGCVDRHPAHVRRWMRLRNLLVRPWRLRTSDIGCPVSSLLSPQPALRFAGRHPVLAILADSPAHADVLLGADDRHLRFRTRIGVVRQPDGAMRVTMAIGVCTLNRFGRFYMRVVDPVHRRWIAPAILQAAVAHALDDAALSPACAADTRPCATP